MSVKPNKNFEIDVEDLDLIEMALFDLQVNTEDTSVKRAILDLRGKLHNQKNWYRPKEGYVSG